MRLAGTSRAEDCGVGLWFLRRCSSPSLRGMNAGSSCAPAVTLVISGTNNREASSGTASPGEALTACRAPIPNGPRATGLLAPARIRCGQGRRLDDRGESEARQPQHGPSRAPLCPKRFQAATRDREPITLRQPDPDPGAPSTRRLEGTPGDPSGAPLPGPPLELARAET